MSATFFHGAEEGFPTKEGLRCLTVTLSRSVFHVAQPHYRCESLAREHLSQPSCLAVDSWLAFCRILPLGLRDKLWLVTYGGYLSTDTVIVCCIPLYIIVLVGGICAFGCLSVNRNDKAVQDLQSPWAHQLVLLQIVYPCYRMLCHHWSLLLPTFGPVISWYLPKASFLLSSLQSRISLFFFFLQLANLAWQKVAGGRWCLPTPPRIVCC